VSLYVNATKIGTKKSSDFTSNMIMQWTNVPWSSGTIKAIGMKAGTQAAVDSITTAGAAAKVLLKPSKTTLYADGDDVSCIEVDIADANNNFIITAADQVQFTMTGVGRSLGIGSGNWTSSEPFKATSRTVYKGKALIVIQSTMDTGTISVTVSSGSLTSASLTLKTVPQQMATVVRSAQAIHALEGQASLLNCIQNPGSKSIRIRYGVDDPGNVNLSVISAEGRMTHCLTNKYYSAGTYSVDWNAVNKNGVYFFVLETNNNKTVKKAVIVR
jgi:hypothetical protein